jgi:hypothetical protein
MTFDLNQSFLSNHRLWMVDGLGSKTPGPIAGEQYRITTMCSSLKSA